MGAAHSPGGAHRARVVRTPVRHVVPRAPMRTALQSPAPRDHGALSGPSAAPRDLPRKDRTRRPGAPRVRRGRAPLLPAPRDLQPRFRTFSLPRLRTRSACPIPHDRSISSSSTSPDSGRSGAARAATALRSRQEARHPCGARGGACPVRATSGQKGARQAETQPKWPQSMSQRTVRSGSGERAERRRGMIAGVLVTPIERKPGLGSLERRPGVPGRPGLGRALLCRLAVTQGAAFGPRGSAGRAWRRITATRSPVLSRPKMSRCNLVQKSSGQITLRRLRVPGRPLPRAHDRVRRSGRGFPRAAAQ